MYDFIEMANYYPIDVRFIELMPLGEGEYFYENGYFITAIRYPTVAKSAARLRVALMSSHTEEELENIDPPPFEYEGKTYSYQKIPNNLNSGKSILPVEIIRKIQPNSNIPCISYEISSGKITEYESVSIMNHDL